MRVYNWYHVPPCTLGNVIIAYLLIYPCILGRTKHLIKDGWISESQSTRGHFLKTAKHQKPELFSLRLPAGWGNQGFGVWTCFYDNFNAYQREAKNCSILMAAEEKTLCQRSWPAWLADTHLLWQDPCRRLWLPASRCQVSLDKSSMLLS